MPYMVEDPLNKKEIQQQDIQKKKKKMFSGQKEKADFQSALNKIKRFNSF